jgi:hypothetical protein
VAFIADATKAIPESRKAAAENQAREVWQNASRINNLSHTWASR